MSSVTSQEFRDRLLSRASRAKVIVTAEMLESLQEYFRLLARWNARINLTAFPLLQPTDETYDRLFVEPLAAAPHVQDGKAVWFDLGAGSGSPAIPLKIARPTLRLTMVESKARKAAFLREAVRVLGLEHTRVEHTRFEEVAIRPNVAGTAGLVTVRAVRPDAVLFSTAAHLLKRHGQLLLFRRSADVPEAEGFDHAQSAVLLENPTVVLGVLRRVFHVEQSR